MVREVSATLVATTQRRVPAGEAWNTCTGREEAIDNERLWFQMVAKQHRLAYYESGGTFIIKKGLLCSHRRVYRLFYNVFEPIRIKDQK